MISQASFLHQNIHHWVLCSQKNKQMKPLDVGASESAHGDLNKMDTILQEATFSKALSGMNVIVS